MRSRWWVWANTSLVAIVSLAFVFPFIWMVSTSLKPADEIFSGGLQLWGSEVAFSNYTEAWTRIDFGRFVLNGLIVAVVGTVLTLIVSVLSAYAFSRLRFRFRDRLFLLFIASMLLPQEVLVIPQFILMRSLGLIDSYAALILSAAFAAFGAFLLRQFLLSVPEELEEAATLDGASRPRIIWSILVPLIRPSLAVLAVFTFIGYWNSFLWPLVIVNSTQMATVPLGLSMFTTQFTTAWHLVMAGCVISTIPSLFIVVFLQRHLVRGLAAGGFGGR
jgi:multiple sugar transport system permease protein